MNCDRNPKTIISRHTTNEGILVSACGSKILFDAFYEDSYGQYLLVPDEIRAALMSGEPPYDDIDAVFVSHVHGDHFSPAPTLAYLGAGIVRGSDPHSELAELDLKAAALFDSFADGCRGGAG